MRGSKLEAGPGACPPVKTALPLLALAALVLLPIGAAAQQPTVLVLRIEGPISGATADYLDEGLEAAGNKGASAVVLVLNTPGGELGATFRITDAILASRVPVVGYVHPQHGVAWSAGTVILLSSHVAAMSPNTVIGSAQPVSLAGGGFAPLNDSKIINALVAKVRELALFHGRNASAAEAFITENLNLNATQALAAGVVEEAESFELRGLLDRVHGRPVRLAAGQNATLDTAGANIVEFERSIRVLFTELLQHPLIASLLLLVGIYALIFGISSPGIGVEIAGLILVVLALVGLGFDVSLVALALLGLGAVLLLFEIHTPGFGVLGISGVAALVFGVLLLAPVSPRGPEGPLFPAGYQASVLIVLLIPAVLLAGFLVFALYKVLEVRKRKPVIGSPVGEAAKALDLIPEGGTGFVLWRGERWSASSEDEVGPGDVVEITSQEGLQLRVRKPREPAPAREDP